MAAGDIIIPDNTITPEILDQIAAEVQNRLSQTAKDPNDWEEVSSLVGVSSLPVFQVSGSVYRLVRVALSVLQGVDGDDGKTPVIEIGTVTEGETASATLTSNGVDASGNPRYKLNLVMPEGTPGTPGTPGTDGKTPKFETGTVTTLNPGEQASASITFKKYDTDGSPIYTVGLSLPKGDKGDTGKTVKMGTVTVTSGETPSGTFSQNGEDSAGNPIYDLALTVQKGENGKDPVFEQGTTTTLDPSAEAYVEVVPNGFTEEGNPKYTLNFGVPRGVQGAAGTGSGNVYVPGTGLQSGKTYLFKPDTDGSTTGTFVEYTVPEIPEQVQPDWNATEGKGAILNKPVIPNVPDWALQPNKPTYTAEEVGALADAPADGKIYGRKGGAWVEVAAEGGGLVAIPYAVLNLTSKSTSEEIKAAIGGDDGFDKIYEGLKNGGAYLDALEGTISGGYLCDMSATGTDSGAQTILVGGTIFTQNILYSVMISRLDGQYACQIETMEQKEPLSLDLDDEGLKGFWVRSNRIDVVNLHDIFQRKVTYSTSEPSSGYDGDIWIQYSE